MAIFGYLQSNFFTSKDSNIPKFELRIVLNEGDYIRRNPDGGPCLGYPKRPKKAQKEPVKQRNIIFLFIPQKKCLESYKIWNGTSYSMQLLSCKIFWPSMNSFMGKNGSKKKIRFKKAHFSIFAHENTVLRSFQPTLCS